MEARKRRLSNWWEPFHEPGANQDFVDGEWDFKNNMKPTRTRFRPDNTTDTKIFRDIHFYKCDFEGAFDYRIVFIGCTFEMTDFGLTTFKKAKFTSCHFQSTSFTMCSLLDCEMRDCTFERINISGNETDLAKTLVTNPIAFFKGAKAHVEHLPAEKSALKQKLKMVETKSTVARRIMATLSEEGSETSFYEGVKANTLLECRARMARSILAVMSAFNNKDLSYFKKLLIVLAQTFTLFFAAADLVLLYIMGAINAWGASLTRPLIFGSFIVFLFSLTYWLFGHSMSNSALKSLEIWFLFGYTKYANLSDSTTTSWVQISNAVAGLCWYAITIPTIVNKLTRVRT